jgi:competence protein ComEC
MSRRRPDPPEGEPVEPREIDLRLAAGAAIAWASVLGTLSWTSVSIAYAAAGAFLIGCVALATTWLLAWAVGPRWKSVLAAVALAALCSAAALLALFARVHQVRDGPLATLVQSRATGVIEATVASDPHPLGANIGGAGARLAIDVTLTGVRSGSRSYRLTAPAVVLTSETGWSTVAPGQRIRLDGRLGAPWSPMDLIASVITARGPPTLVGQPPWWQRAAVAVRADLREASSGLPASERGLLPGLIEGDTTGLDPVLAEQFRVAGLTHLVAVSGTNVAVVVGAVLLVLRRFGVRPWFCAVCGGLVLIAFVIVARPSPSVVRAAVMAAVVLVALASGRPRQGIPGMAVAVLALLLWRPEWAVNAGFAMSVLATGTLLIVAPGWALALRWRHVPPILAEGIAVAAAASLVTAPVIVALSGRLSLVALPANVLAEVAVAPATVLGVLAAVVAPFWSPGGAFFAQLAGVPCRWLAASAEFFGSRPGATIAWPSSLVGALALSVLTVAIVLAVRVQRLRLPLLAAAVVALIVQIPVRALTTDWPVAGAIFVACDVGQGDGLVIPVSADSAIVIDSGPDPVAIDRCLRSLGITRVLVYVQTHLHQDHIGGIAGVVRGRQVGLVLTGPLLTPAGGRSELENALRPFGTTAQIASVGDQVTAGGVVLDVLAAHIVDIDGQPDPNDSSLVLRATVRGQRILLTGDASIAGQQWLLQSGADLRADVLKVAHHGSAYFDPDFYAAVQAQVAVISLGAHNLYGHPSPRVLNTLAALRVPVERTDQDGDVAIAAAGHGLRAVSHRHSVTASGATVVRRSEVRATIGGWPPQRSAPTPTSTTAASSWSLGTRSFFSTGPSKRWGGPVAGWIPVRMSSNSRAPPLLPRSCTRC